jgi:ABC-type transport system involved in multi-copper enzyme maturation permease subunit
MNPEDLKPVLQRAALIALLAGAFGSVGFMLRAGHPNPSRVLLLLFAIWVLSPFVALVFAIIVSKDSSVLRRATLYGVVVVLTVSSLAIYGAVAFGPPRTKTAFAFVVVPPASWLLIAITVSIAALISRRRARQSNNG